MAFVEMFHKTAQEYFTVETGEDITFPAHIHYCYEIIAVTKGEMNVAVGEESFLLTPGFLAVIFPGQVHSMTTEKSSSYRLCIFSPDVVGRYSSTERGSYPESCLFKPSDEMYGLFCKLRQGKNNDIYTVKGILYLILSEFAENAEMRPLKSKGPSEQLIYRMLGYIQNNYTGECTLNAAAKEFKYDYTYLSKLFKSGIGMSFADYVGMMRISEACYLLESTADTVLEISNKCGFNSLRTFNRAFFARTGSTPAKYRSLKGRKPDKSAEESRIRDQLILNKQI